MLNIVLSLFNGAFYCEFFWNCSLSARFITARHRVALSGLLAFTFGITRWFFSGFKKDHGKRLNFWSKIDFIEKTKFSKKIIFSFFQKINWFYWFLIDFPFKSIVGIMNYESRACFQRKISWKSIKSFYFFKIETKSLL